MTTAPDSNQAGKPVASKRNFTTILLLVIILAGAFYYFASKKAGNQIGSSPARGGLAIGETAPEIKATGWVNGEPPADLSGKVVVVDAWATWCMPCKIEAPHLVETYQMFADRDDVIFIGLTTEEEKSLPAINAFLDDVKITWSNGYGATETLQAFQADYIPSVWVINKQGKIIWNFDSTEEISDAISRALND